MKRRTFPLPRVVLGLLLVGFLPGMARAQEVRGRLVTATGEPVPWALVRLIDADGNEAATVISSASGAFHLRAAAEGTYRVQAERIGFAATVSDPLSLNPGQSDALVLTATDDPIELPPIDVGTESVCGLGRRAGPSLLAVWAEVRKALELQVGTEEGGAYEFVGEHYEYEVDRKGRPTDEKRAAESTRRFRFSGSSGFHAIEPDMLARLGYRVLTPEGRIQYFAPDARTLLSESFQARHCYSVKWDGDRLGLRFEPAALSGHKVDVDGALWLDGETGALQTIEFEYVSEGIPDYRLDGGYVEFEQLPEGAWIVRRWWLREPVYSRKATLRERRESPLLEAGARILSVEKRAPVAAPTPDRVAPSRELQPDRRPASAAGTRDTTTARPGWTDAERARQLFADGKTAEAAAAFRSACASGDSLTLESLWTDLRGLATRAELDEWEARPTQRRCALLGSLVAERAVRAGLTVADRLALHYGRLSRVREEWGLAEPRVQAGAAESYGRHTDLEFDDRGLVYLRMGEPDAVSVAFAGETGEMGHRIEGWRYDRPEGPRLFFFAPVTSLGMGLSDYRLLDAPWRAMGRSNAARPQDFVQGRISPVALHDLYLSFQDLDPRYPTLALRARTQADATLLQDLTEDREQTLVDLAFVVDSVPDAPDLDLDLRFAWERLRFFDPSTGQTDVWLLAAVPTEDLEARTDGDGDHVYRLGLAAALQIGNAVSLESTIAEARVDAARARDAAVIARVPVTTGTGVHPLTLSVSDRNDEERTSGNWTRADVTGLQPSNLPEISDLAVAADSGGAWSRDGETFLPVTPSHVTSRDGELHLYFEVYGLQDGTPFEVEIRAVPAGDAERIWAVAPGRLAYRASFTSRMPETGGISSHHLRLDLSETPDGMYAVGVRVTDAGSGRTSLPATTPVLRSR